MLYPFLINTAIPYRHSAVASCFEAKSTLSKRIVYRNRATAKKGLRISGVTRRSRWGCTSL